MSFSVKTGYILLALVPTLSAAGTTQSATVACAVADSFRHAGLKSGELKLKYDEFTDSTTLSTKSDNRMMASMTIVAAFRGRTWTPDSTRVAFVYQERQVQFRPGTPLAPQYSAESTVYLLLDGDERLPLTHGTYRNATDNGMLGLAPPSLTETLEFELSRPQLLRIAAAREIRIKARAFDTKVASKLLEGSRTLAADVSCVPAGAEPTQL